MKEGEKNNVLDLKPNMYINVKYKSLNTPIKRKRLLECIYNKTQLYAVYFKYEDIDCLKGKGWKKYTMQKYTTNERME